MRPCDNRHVVSRWQLEPVPLRVVLLLNFAFAFLEFFSEVVSEEARVLVTHLAVRVTEALKMRDRELPGSEGGVHVRQLQQLASAFRAPGFRE